MESDQLLPTWSGNGRRVPACIRVNVVISHDDAVGDGRLFESVTTP